MSFFQNDFFNGAYFEKPFFKKAFFQQDYFTGLGSTAPSAFADPTISGASATGFTVNWLAPSGDPVNNYYVEVKTNVGATHITGSPFMMAGSTLKKVVSGLTASTAYDVKVIAVNHGGSTETGVVIMSTTA